LLEPRTRGKEMTVDRLRAHGMGHDCSLLAGQICQVHARSHNGFSRIQSLGSWLRWLHEPLLVLHVRASAREHIAIRWAGHRWYLPKQKLSASRARDASI